MQPAGRGFTITVTIRFHFPQKWAECCPDSTPAPANGQTEECTLAQVGAHSGEMSYSGSRGSLGQRLAELAGRRAALTGIRLTGRGLSRVTLAAVTLTE